MKKNQKNKKIIVVVAIAIIAALTTGVLIYLFLTPQRSTVYVFKEDYDAGTIITGTMLTPVQVDSKVIAAGSKSGVSNYFITSDTYQSLVKSDTTLLTNVTKGQPLMSAIVSSSGGNGIQGLMDSTAVAITIPVNNTTGISPGIKAESHVNVYVTYNSGGTHLLLENVRILKVSTSDNGAISGFTLELNNAEAVKIINAVNTGSVYCGLTNATGYIYNAEQ